MSSRVVKCGVQRSKGLVSTVLDQGRLICTNCGTEVTNQNTLESDLTHHQFYEFIGAYCPVDKMIHYRWIKNTWSVSENPVIRPRKDTEALILPKSTEVKAEKYFLKSHYWNQDAGECYDPGYTEVVWSDFDDSKFVLLRPTDTGYLKINSQGIHTPFIAALIEWLLKKEKWTDIAELANQSIIAKREKQIIKHAVATPTPSNIFKFLWTFRRFIPGWNSKRSLGKRSPAMLILDEIRWTTNRLEEMDETDRDRLIRYGPEPQYWNVWPEMWSKSIDLGGTLADFGDELKRLGIHYGETLDLIWKPKIKQNERSWMQMADKMIQWPINVKKGGEVDTTLSQREDRGFVTNLMNNLKVAIEKKPIKNEKWAEYLTINLPLVWQQNGSEFNFHSDMTIMTKSDLQETLKVLKPWISGEVRTSLVLEIEVTNEESSKYIIESFSRRISKTSIDITITK